MSPISKANRICLYCKHWFPNGDYCSNKPDKPLLHFIETHNIAGSDCRRYPHYVCRNRYDWCGEFELDERLFEQIV